MGSHWHVFCRYTAHDLKRLHIEDIHEHMDIYSLQCQRCPYLRCFPLYEQAIDVIHENALNYRELSYATQ